MATSPLTVWYVSLFLMYSYCIAIAIDHKRLLSCKHAANKALFFTNIESCDPYSNSLTAKKNNVLILLMNDLE